MQETLREICNSLVRNKEKVHGFVRKEGRTLEWVSQGEDVVKERSCLIILKRDVALEGPNEFTPENLQKNVMFVNTTKD